MILCQSAENISPIKRKVLVVQRTTELFSLGRPTQNPVV